MSDLAFHALRDYQPGDDRRYIHWRSSAKAGRFLVRQFLDTRRSHVAVVVDSEAANYTDPDEFELAIRNETTWIQGMPGEDRVCGGCHEDRTQPSLPNGQALTIARGRGPEDFMTPVLMRTEYPWNKANDPANANQIQTLLNAKCVSCHNEKTNGDKPQEFYEVKSMNAVTGASYDYMITRMDLTDRDITVTYDRQTKAWPA